MLDVRRAEESRKTRQDRLADALTRFSGNMWFVYIHAIWFGWWIADNKGWIPGTVFDPFPFGLLTLIVSLEAIFLATFVLISQNRAAAVADMRSDLDLQIDLLAEYEVTQLLRIVAAIGRKIDVDGCDTPELAELTRTVTVQEVINEMQLRAGG
ncbi:MAG TPA: DUF1003 domain-containing protein [Vicinamibacterales bacterium]|nr:DUF1003 domain-containing protein [Vicinamibacterales bacterium]